jgi:hypothetical protein
MGEVRLMPKFREMKQPEIKILKEKIWRANEKQCPVLQRKVPLDKMVLDHIHKRKADQYDVDKGTIRTALEFRINAFFGKIENAYKRYGLKDEMPLPELLRKGADYLEEEPYSEEGEYFIHPHEVHKRVKVMKSEFNRVKKYYFKVYPNRKKMIKKPTYVSTKWQELVKLVDDYIAEHGK